MVSSQASGLDLLKSQPLEHVPLLEAERDVSWEAEKKEAHLVWHMLPIIRKRGCVWLCWDGQIVAVRTDRSGNAPLFKKCLLDSVPGVAPGTGTTYDVSGRTNRAYLLR